MATSREVKTIANFKSQLVGGGARPNLFEVELATLPDGISWPENAQRTWTYLCKAAQLPASNIAQIDIPFRGRIFKVAGDRTVEPGLSPLLMMKTLKLETLWNSGLKKWRN